MPNELTLCAVAAAVGALLGGVIVHKLDSAALAHEQKAHADDIARINATAAQQLADAVKRGQAAEGHIATLEQQYNDEIAKHAKDNLDYRAQLLAGTQHVRVRVTGCGGSSTAGKGTTAPGSADAAAPGADVSSAYVAGADAVNAGIATLAPSTAASVFAVVDDADDTASRLRALQAYVKEMQNDGYINK